MKPEYIIGLILVVLLAVGVGFIVLNIHTAEPSLMGDEPSKDKNTEGVPYKEIVDPSGFVNTDGITVGELIGKKVILVDFMTYSCINCQRTFPYVTAWYEKYKDQGLEVIGIHTPEFAFEKDINNVRTAMKQFGITYPVVLDNNYATWRAYQNNYWPRKYLIDIHGNIVYDHAGEGAYKETEMKIQELLKERAEVLGTQTDMSDSEGLAVDNISGVSPEARSPETYFGALRNEYLANGTSGALGEQTFAISKIILPNKLYLGGMWNVLQEYAQSEEGGTVMYRYNAKELYFVAQSDTPVEVEVYQDGVLVSDARGADVNMDGVVTIGGSRLYKLIKNEKAGEHVLELKIRGTGLKAYTFTFG